MNQKTNTGNNSVSGSRTYLLTTCAIMTALMCICGPLVVPIGPVPISLTNLVLYVSVFLLGIKGTLISYVVYLLLGMVGLPVFSGYVGGLAKVAGPTGGYLVGFLPMLLIMAVFFRPGSVGGGKRTGDGKALSVQEKSEKRRSTQNVIITFIGMILGTIVAYAFGTVWFVLLMGCDVLYALTICVFPFIGFDIAKMVIAILLGNSVRTALLRAGLIR